MLSDPNVAMDCTFLQEAKEMDAAILSWIVAILKKKDFKLMTGTAAMKLLKKDCIAHPKQRRLFVQLTAAQLKKLAEDLHIKTSGLKNEALIDQLIVTMDGAEDYNQQQCQPSVVHEWLQPLVAAMKSPF
jgi:hypothetical protein